MIAIILAAGLGSRFGEAKPKPLTLLHNGESIMEWQIFHLKKMHIPSIIAVVGFKKELIMELFPEILYVYNPHYAVENTSKSLLRALFHCKEDILWMNGDVLFHPQVLKDLMNQKNPAMLVNKTVVGEEEVKYCLDIEGYIQEVSKKVSDPLGEALGINFFPQKWVKKLCKNLEACRKEDYFEQGIQLCIEEGVKISPVFCEISDCIEIDFPEDLEKANTLISSWKYRL